MSRFVYFYYSGNFYHSVAFLGPPIPYRFIVEVCRKDCEGGDRDPLELRRVAISLLQMRIGEERAKVVESLATRTEIDHQRFGEIRKSQVYSTRDGAVYEVLPPLPSSK
jgi:hypothetical protein